MIQVSSGIGGRHLQIKNLDFESLNDLKVSRVILIEVQNPIEGTHQRRNKHQEEKRLCSLIENKWACKMGEGGNLITTTIH